MFKPLVVTTRPTELKIRKYHLKYINSLTLPFKPSSVPKTSHVKSIKKTKRFFKSKLRYETKSTVVLSLIKHFGKSLMDVPPMCIPKYAKELKGLTNYQFDTRTFAAWKNLLYIAKTLKNLTVYTNPLRDLHKTKVPKKNGLQLSHLDRDKTKTHLLSRCMDRFTNLEHISFFMRLDEDHHRLLCLFEKFSDHLKNLKGIDMTIISFIGKLGLSSRNFPNLLSHVKLFKLYAQDNINQIDEILTNFHLFGKLNSLYIVCDNCKQGSWTMFRCIAKLKSLQKLELWLTQPSLEVCYELLDHISLPESLVSFTFGLSSVNPNLSQQLFEDSNWEDYSIFTCPRRFKRFITAIHSCRRLQELRIEFDKTRFVKEFNNLFINLCENLEGIRQFSILIKESEERDPEEYNEEGAFRFDLMLQSNANLLRNIKSFELTVPTFSMRNLPENLELPELTYLKLSGRLFETTDNDKLAVFLSKIQPREDFKIMLSELEVDDEEKCRNILEKIISIPKLRSFVFMFETILDKTIIFAVLKEFVSAETAALIKFPTTNDVSFAYNKKFKEFLRKNRKEGGIQNHEDGVIIRWKPIGAV